MDFHDKLSKLEKNNGYSDLYGENRSTTTVLEDINLKNTIQENKKVLKIRTYNYDLIIKSKNITENTEKYYDIKRSLSYKRDIEDKTDMNFCINFENNDNKTACCLNNNSNCLIF